MMLVFAAIHAVHLAVLSVPCFINTGQRSLRLAQLAEDSLMEVQIAAAISAVTRIEAWSQRDKDLEVSVDFNNWIRERGDARAEATALARNDALASRSGRSATQVFATVQKTSVRRPVIISLAWCSETGVEINHDVEMLSARRLYFEVGLIIITMILDLNSARLFLLGRYYGFAFCTLTVSWFAFLKKIPTWMSLRKEMQASLKLGYYTDVLVAMRRTERSIEGFLDMVISFYGLPWAFSSWQQLLQFVFQILLGMRSVVIQLAERDQWRRHDEGLGVDRRTNSFVEGRDIATINGEPIPSNRFSDRRTSRKHLSSAAARQQQRDPYDNKENVGVELAPIQPSKLLTLRPMVKQGYASPGRGRVGWPRREASHVNDVKLDV